MDIKSTQTVQMTVSLPESNDSTTWTTPEVSKHYFDSFPSSCVIILNQRDEELQRLWEE